MQDEGQTIDKFAGGRPLTGVPESVVRQNREDLLRAVQRAPQLPREAVGTGGHGNGRWRATNHPNLSALMPTARSCGPPFGGNAVAVCAQDFTGWRSRFNSMTGPGEISQSDLGRTNRCLGVRDRGQMSLWRDWSK